MPAPVPGEPRRAPARSLAVLALLALALLGPGAADARRPRTVVLLDLNYTFVENQAETGRLGGDDFARRIGFERYRRWLLDLVRDRTVVMITARPERHREATLARIDSLLGWRPHRAYFNTRDLPPPACKRDILERLVFPEFGRPDAVPYVAIESNPRTTVMYREYGIPAMRVWDEWQYGDSTKVIK